MPSRKHARGRRRGRVSPHTGRTHPTRSCAARVVFPGTIHPRRLEKGPPRMTTTVARGTGRSGSRGGPGILGILGGAVRERRTLAPTAPISRLRFLPSLVPVPVPEPVMSSSFPRSVTDGGSYAAILSGSRLMTNYHTRWRNHISSGTSGSASRRQGSSRALPRPFRRRCRRGRRATSAAKPRGGSP